MSEPVEETIARLRASVSANPNNPVTRLMLGKAYQQVGRIDDALGSVLKATTLKPDYFEALVALGGLHRVKEDAASAAVAFASAVKTKPTATDVWLELARARRDAHDDAGAMDAYAHVLTERPTELEALRDGGLAAHRVAAHERGVEWLDRAVAAAPEAEANGDVQLARARSAAALGRPGAAILAYARAIALGREDAGVRREEALALVADARARDAIVSYVRAAELDPARIDVVRERGELERTLGSLDGASAAFSRWAALAPDDGEAFFALGAVLALARRGTEAVDALARASRLLPERADIALAWGRALHTENRAREAAEVLERVAVDSAPSAEAHVALAEVYRTLVRAKDARALLERARERWPADARVHRALGETFEREDALERAAESYARAVALDPKDATLALRHAEVRLALGDHAHALPLFDGLRHGSHADETTRQSAHAGAGECLLALARPVEACEAFELAGSSIRALVGAGLSLLELGRVSEAEGLLKRAVALDDPRFGMRALAALGDAYVRLGKFDDARGAYRRTLMQLTASGIEDRDLDEARSGEMRLSIVAAPATTNEKTELPSALATVHGALVRARFAAVELELGRPAEALAIADAGLAKAAEDGGLHRVRAAALTALSRTREAVEAIEQALWHAPEDAELVSAMGTTLAEIGNHAKALPYLERAIARNPDDLALTRALARTLVAVGRWEDGCKAYRQCATSRRGTADDWLEVATLEERGQRFQEAADAYRECVRLDPERLAGYRGAGRLYRRLGKPEDAMRSLRHAVRLEERDLDTWLELARTQRELSRLDDAVESYGRAFALTDVARDRAVIDRELAQVLVTLREDARAEAALSRATTADPSDVDSHRLLAEIRARLGMSGGAREALEAAHARGDHASSTRMALALAREQAGDLEGALALYRDAALAETSETTKSAPWAVARLLLARGEFADALTWCDRALSVGDESIDVHLGAAESAIATQSAGRAWVAVRRALALAPTSKPAQRMRARLAVAEGKWQEAAEACEKVLMSEPDAVDALRGLGLACAQLARWQQAERPLERVLTQAPADVAILVALGRTKSALGRGSDAVPLLGRAIEAHERTGSAGTASWLEAVEALARTFIALGATADAADLLERAARTSPQEAMLYRLLGEARAARGDQANAVTAFAQAVELAPGDGATRAQLGMALALSGHDEAAVTELARAQARNALDGRGAYVYGICLHRLGRLGEAREAYATAVARGIDEFDCQRALGDTCVATGRDTEAVEAYSSALVKQPGDANARIALALALHRTGRPAEAMEQYRALRVQHSARAEQLFRMLQGG